MIEDKAIEVLLVDDEDRFRVTTTATLKKRGFSVKAVASGVEAIEEIKKSEVDVVVLDIKMPEMDGHETLKMIKKLKPETEIIMLTGYGSLGSAVADMHDGVFAFLIKPCSVDFLASRIREAFAKKGGASEYNRRARDIMVPLTAFVSTIHEDQSVAEAVDVILKFLDKAITPARLQETLHRPMLVLDRHDEAVGVIGFPDLLRGMQAPCMTLLEEQPVARHSFFLDSSNYLGRFATMVRERASRKIHELLPEKPVAIDADADLMETTDKLLSNKVHSLLVVEDNTVVGVVREKDLFLEMAKIIKEHRAEISAS